MGQAEDEARKKQLIADYSAARDRLDAAIGKRAPTAVCGGWTVVEIAAQVVAWEQNSAEAMFALAGGTAKPAVDADKMNAAAAAEARKAPPEQTMAMYREARSIFVDSLSELPAAAFAMPSVCGEIEMERDHALEHATELDAL